MKIHYLLVLDKSGSMFGFTEMTKQALRNYIQEIRSSTKNNCVDGYLTLVAFDADSENPFDYFYKVTPINEVDERIIDNYRTYGGTQLIDAIANGVLNLQTLAGDELGEEDTYVLAQIYSDGAENSSRLFSKLQIKNMIEILSEGRWTFTFQCAGAEAGIREFAKSISIADNNVMAYEATEKGYSTAYSSLTSSIGVYTTGIACQQKIEGLFAK